MRKYGIALFVFLAVIMGQSLPVQSLAPMQGLFNPSEMYRQLFQTTSWLGDTRREEARLGRLDPNSPMHLPASVKYPYPEKEFVMTEAHWQHAVAAIEAGTEQWFDIEIVRQRAAMEGHAPAMDFLAWMYEHGRALKRNPREAVLWYNRAEIAGVKKPRGNKFAIFKRQLTHKDQRVVKRQIDEEEKEKKGGSPNFFEGITQQIFASR